MVKWTTVANLKKLVGWGIKNPYLFFQALVSKPRLRLTKDTNSLWGKIMTSKYYPNSSIIEWFIRPEKSHKGGYVGWKEMVLSFPIIGKWMAWEIGDGRSV